MGESPQPQKRGMERWEMAGKIPVFTDKSLNLLKAYSVNIRPFEVAGQRKTRFPVLLYNLGYNT